MNKKIIFKIKKAGLLGRSGSCFPSWIKWEALTKSKSEKKYIVCNGSEGELETFKDKFILENYPGDVINGLKIALKTLDAEKAYIYLNKEYYRKYKKTLEKITDKRFHFFKKEEGYIAGEETSIMEAIEGKKPVPRIKPPFPTESGLWGYPTLIHNVETFYCISRIVKNKYQKERFYSVAGDAKNKGVFEFKDGVSIKKILKKTENYPSFEFFLQVGGGACGEIMTEKEISQPIKSLASIIIYNKKKTDCYALMKKWSDFLLYGNCDKCVPCREGIYRISEMVDKKDLTGIEDVFFVLEKTSRCLLGKIAALPFKTLIKKIMK